MLIFGWLTAMWVLHDPDKDWWMKILSTYLLAKRLALNLMFQKSWKRLMLKLISCLFPTENKTSAIFNCFNIFTLISDPKKASPLPPSRASSRAAAPLAKATGVCFSEDLMPPQQRSTHGSPAFLARSPRHSLSPINGQQYALERSSPLQDRYPHLFFCFLIIFELKNKIEII